MTSNSNEGQQQSMEIKIMISDIKQNMKKLWRIVENTTRYQSDYKSDNSAFKQKS